MPASSLPIMREYPATSAQTMAARRLSISEELQRMADRPRRGSRPESRISKNPAFIEQIEPRESMIRIANSR